MNEEQYFAAAKHLAINVLEKYPTDKQRVEFLFESLTAQKPDQEEFRPLLRGLAELKFEYETNSELADQLTEKIELDGKTKKSDVAALSTLINSLFNLDVTKTRN